MPYPLAHAAAAIALAPLLGRYAVPSALAIGTVIPDAWYLLPALAERGDSHSLPGLLLFCLPAGLAAWYAFHAIKLPLLGLLPDPITARLAPYLSPPVQLVSLWRVAACILLGAATHLAWDDLGARHASTLGGSLFVMAWLWHKLRATRPLRLRNPYAATAAERRRVFAALALCAAAVAATSTWAVKPSITPFDYESARLLARTAGLDACVIVLWLLAGYGALRRFGRSGR